MAKEIRKHLAFRSTMLGKVVRPCAMLTAVALGIALPAASKAAATEIAEQAQAEPTAGQAQAAAAPLPTDVERESWRRTILKTPRPKKACFVATYPGRSGQSESHRFLIRQFRILLEKTKWQTSLSQGTQALLRTM